MTKIDKFYEVKNLLQCPICGKKIRFHAGGLVCKREHRFDISSKGYVNLLQERKRLKGYDKSFFESRSRFLRAGYYDHVLRAIQNVVSELLDAREMQRSEEPCIILDAGCGEGYYSANLCSMSTGEHGEMAGEDGKRSNVQFLAFDISADAVQIAARSNEQVKWMVADITNIPVKDAAVDCILDLFTPANYGEFYRVLKSDGAVIKAVPGAHHMEQVRRIAAPYLHKETYSNEEVLEYFEQHFNLEKTIAVSATLEVSKEDLDDLIHMTPLLFDVDREMPELKEIEEITVEAEILVGRSQKNKR